MLHIVELCSMGTPGITNIGVGELVERGMPVTMRKVGKPEFGEANAVGPRTLLIFADLGGMIVQRVPLAEMAGEPDGVVMFVEGAGEADGTMTSLEVPGNDERGRVLLANGKTKLETRILSLDVAGGKDLKLVPLADSVGEAETMIVPLEVGGDSDAKKLVMFVDRVGEAEGTITTLEVDKLVSVSFGVGISEMALVVRGNIVLIVPVVMPAVTVRLYLVVVSLGLAVRVLIVVIDLGTEIVLGSRYKQLQALEKAKRRSSSAAPSATSRAAGTASRNGAKSVGYGARFRFSLTEVVSMGPKVIVRVEEGTVSADGMLTVIVVVTRAVAVLNLSQLLFKPKKPGRVKRQTF